MSKFVYDCRKSASSPYNQWKRSMERSVDSELKDLDSGFDSATAYLE